MRLQAQVSNECFLTAVAILLDSPVEQVREVWMQSDPTGQRRLPDPSVLSGIEFWAVVWPFLERTLGTQFTEAYKAAMGWAYMPQKGRMGLTATLSDASLQVPATGKGLLQVASRSYGYVRHSVAYENGLVFDPGKSDLGPLTWEGWLVAQARKDELCSEEPVVWFIEAVIPA